MTIYDMHSHWGTWRGYRLRSEAELAQQRKTWNSDPAYATEAEMAEYFRRSGVRVVLDFGFEKELPLDEVAALHDYGFAVQREHPDAILGHWVHVDPKSGADGVRELRRCRDRSDAFLGFAVAGSGIGPASEPMWEPYYRLCIEAGIPVLIFVGTTGEGAGLPGGGGVILEDCHPRHLDRVAARWPELAIVAARPGWPWQAETIAVLMHKRNIWYELHGWSPKYFTPDLKHDIARRLKDRVMFGADYPLFTYERLLSDWRAEGYSEAVLERVFTRNAAAFLASLAPRPPMGSGPIVLAFCTALVAVAAGPACAASRFDALVVFGDSLSDGGNAGRASNGPVWVEYLAASLGLPLAPSTASGTNYATGGALAQGGGYSLRAQADDFLRRIAPGGADPRALYVVWGGANDLRAAVGTPQAGEAVRGAVAAVRSVVADLAAAGARDILLPNLPALGRAPEWHGRAAAATEATALARAFNRGLARALPAAMQGGVRLLRLDVMALLERIAEDPAAAGFANLTDPCRTETAICADPARYVFWDEIHPTTAAHALLARRAAAVLAQPR